MQGINLGKNLCRSSRPQQNTKRVCCQQVAEDAEELKTAKYLCLSDKGCIFQPLDFEIQGEVGLSHLLSWGGGCLDRMNLRKNAFCHWDRSEKVNDNEIESRFSNTKRFQTTLFSAVGYAPISPSTPRPLGAAYVPILLSEIEQEQTPSENRDRGAIVLEAGFCDGEGEGGDTIYDPVLGGEQYLKYCKRFAAAKTVQERNSSI